MTLPTFDTIDAVPEPFRPFYMERDGKVVPDLVPGAEVVGLRNNAKALLDEKKALVARFDGIDPDEYRALKASGGKVKDLDARLTAAAQKEAELTAKLATLQGTLKGNAKKAEVTRALAEAGGNIDLLEPLVSQMVDVEETDGRMHVVVRDAQGAVRYKDGAGTRFGVSDLLAEMKAKPAFQPAFSVPVGSGSNARPGTGSAAGVRLIDAKDKGAVVAGLADIRAGKARIAG